MKVEITERAFLARMKRHLAKEGFTLHQGREGTHGYGELGRFYTVNTSTSFVDHKGLELTTLENWAREKGVLKPHEVIQSATS